MIVTLVDCEGPVLEFLENHLSRWGYQTVPLSTEEALERIAEPHPPRLALFRWRDQAKGTAFVEGVRNLDSAVHTSLLAVVDRAHCYEVQKALSASLVDDCLLLPLDAYVLETRLLVVRKSLTQREKIVQFQRAWDMQTLKDGLTGLWSREATLEFLERELQKGRRTESSVGVVMITLRDLGRYNRTAGYGAGDRLIKAVADRLRTAVRATDWVGRYPGNHFLMVLPDCSEQRVLQVGGRLAACARTALELEEPQAPPTLGMGAVASVAGRDKVEELMSRVRSEQS